MVFTHNYFLFNLQIFTHNIQQQSKTRHHLFSCTKVHNNNYLCVRIHLLVALYNKKSKLEYAAMLYATLLEGEVNGRIGLAGSPKDR